MSSTKTPSKVLVKGTLLLDYVRLIRKMPEKNWGRWLTEEDWKIIKGQVLASGKYPYAAYCRIGYAVFMEAAGGNFEAVRVYGHFALKSLMEVYGKSVVVPGNAAASIEKFAQLYQVWMTGGVQSQFERLGEKKMVMHLFPPDEGQNEDVVKAYMYQVAGQTEELVKIVADVPCKTSVTKVGAGYDIVADWS